MMKLLLSLFLVTAARAAVPCPERAQALAPAYEIEGVVIAPSAELREPFHAWFDDEAGYSRIDYYEGTSTIYQMRNYPKGNGSYTLVVPVTTENYANVKTCLQWLGNGGVWPLSIIPDISDYKCEGNGKINGVEAQRWTLTVPVGPKFNKNTMWVQWYEDEETKELTMKPVFYEVKGSDRYFIEFFNYRKGTPDKSLWNDPQTMKCGPTAPEVVPSGVTNNPIEMFLGHHETHMNFAWHHYLHAHKKEYNSPAEHIMRKNTFSKNHRLVHAHNTGKHSYRLALNHFADWTKEEMKSLRGRVESNQYYDATAFPYNQKQLHKIAQRMPKNFDWRLRGAVTPVKNQFSCGSCWSFGTTGTIEGANFLKTGKLLRFSEQALVDCTWGFGNAGCNGGWEVNAYQWIIKHGLPLEDDYRYLSFDGRCHSNETESHATVTGWVAVPVNNTLALKVALFKKGPISLGINADPATFAFYASGVYDDPACNANDIDHAVLAVGYGVMDGKPYWLIKNSWSSWWGDEGYILIAMKNNVCGVTTGGTYVIM